MIKKLAIVFILMFCFLDNTKAICYDEDLNSWAVDAEVEFVHFNRNLINEQTNEPLGNTMLYAYILTLNSQRDDIVIKATADNGSTFEGIYVPGHKVYGIVDYTSTKAINYQIKIYGSKDSACPNEELKTLNYEVGPYNYYYKTEKCENYPDAPLCQMYKDTSDISNEEFNKQMDEYIGVREPEEDPTLFDKFMNFMLNYGIYVLIPFVVISTIYLVKIKKLKKAEGEK